MAYNRWMRFEWDDVKDHNNVKKHGLSFSEATRLFEEGSDYLEIFDWAHSDVEDRYIAMGEIDRGTVVVVYAETDDDLIRIIGARFATARERERYGTYMRQKR